MTTVSNERLARIKTIANIVAFRMDLGSTPEAIAEHILSSLEASPAPVSEHSAVTKARDIGRGLSASLAAKGGQ